MPRTEATRKLGFLRTWPRYMNAVDVGHEPPFPWRLKAKQSGPRANAHVGEAFVGFFQPRCVRFGARPDSEAETFTRPPAVVGGVLDMRLPEPRAMLFLDGLGGFATALMLCLVLPSFHSAIGLSPRTLVVLGLFGGVYGCYSLGCWKLVRNRWRRALTIIIAANVLYCVVSALVLVTHRETMTGLGVSYFLAEIAVILALVGTEVAVLNRCQKAER